MDLNAFVAEHAREGDGRRRRCLTCNLSDGLLKQVHAGRQHTPKPISFEIISKWLEEKHNTKIQANTIRNHFVAGHHRD